nr:hypothetical protein [Lachnospiraceae bacterium]
WAYEEFLLSGAQFFEKIRASESISSSICPNSLHNTSQRGKIGASRHGRSYICPRRHIFFLISHIFFLASRISPCTRK